MGEFLLKAILLAYLIAAIWILLPLFFRILGMLAWAVVLFLIFVFLAVTFGGVNV